MTPSTAPTQIEGAESGDHVDTRPTLYGDTSFWGMTATQFLGAFNDNLFKQLMLLLALGAAAGADDDQQGTATLVFALPFVLFSGFAGYLADRHSKRTVVVLAKVVELGVMTLGLFAFAWFEISGYRGLLLVLFLMGMQSTFFGPAKYGILPEMLRGRDLPRANGIFLMTTFVAIILGTVSAGVLKKQFSDSLWIASSFCVAIALVGIVTSLLVRPLLASRPEMRMSIASFGISGEIVRLSLRDPPVLAALLVSCLFWMVGSLVMMTVNALGKLQLGLGDDWTSVLTAGIALGISVGCIAGGIVSRGQCDFRLVRIGAWGIVACLVLLALPGAGPQRHWLGFWGSLPTLILMGGFTGLFIVPVQVYLQAHPPAGLKGRMIAMMNLANWIAILLSGPLYGVVGDGLRRAGLAPCGMFAATALIMLPVALLYRPRNEQLG